MLWLLDTQRKAIVVLETAFWDQSIIGPTGFRRIAANQQTGLVRMRLPQAIRIRNPHLQNASVAVDVLDDQSLDLLFVVRIRPRARAHPSRLVGERPFGAVGIDPRTEVERTRIERARHVGVVSVLRDERVKEIEIRRGRSDLRRMDVAVDPKCRFFCSGPRPRVGGGHHPDVAAFVALSNRFDGEQVGILASERVQDLAQFGVAVETVESNCGHEKSRR